VGQPFAWKEEVQRPTFISKSIATPRLPERRREKNYRKKWFEKREIPDSIPPVSPSIDRRKKTLTGGLAGYYLW